MKGNITKEAKLKITYSKMFWLFLLGSLVGFVLEGLYMSSKSQTHRRRADERVNNHSLSALFILQKYNPITNGLNNKAAVSFTL